jgi:hypothetical protein
MRTAPSRWIPAPFQSQPELWPPTAPAGSPDLTLLLPPDAGAPGSGPELRAAATDTAGDCEPGPGARAAADGRSLVQQRGLARLGGSVQKVEAPVVLPPPPPSPASGLSLALVPGR